MKWEKYSLGDLIEIKKGSYITKKESIEGPYPVILGGQEPAYYIDRYNHTGKAIVVSRSGASAGFVSRWNEPIFVTDGFLIEPKEKVLFDFLYYLMKKCQPYLQGLQGGAAIPHVNPRIINAIEVLLPSIDEQKRIVKVLSAYDDLIENNKKQIKLLEEAAQRLYKEWFIDLRFTGHENTPIHDGIPEGWEMKTVGDLCALMKQTIAPEAIAPSTPYIGLEHIPRKDFCLSQWSTASKATSNKYLFNKGDILFGQIRPYFHKVGFAIVDGVASTDSFVMRANENTWGLFLMTVSSEAFVNYSYQTCKEGAKMPRADWNQMKKYEVLIASAPVQKQFETIKSTTKESESLNMDEMRKTLEAAEEEPIKWKTMLHVMLAGGLRRGEALGLEWKNFDSTECTIKVEKTVLYKREFGVYYDTPKSNRGRREIILPPETVEILLDYKEWLDQTKQNAGPLWEENGLIFPNNTGRPMNPDSVTKWFHEFSERHDLPHIHPHMMRHTTASMLIQGQRDVYSVSSFMGHAKPSITMDIYSHEFSAYNEKNAAVIRDAIYPQKKKDES